MEVDPGSTQSFFSSSLPTLSPPVRTRPYLPSGMTCLVPCYLPYLLRYPGYLPTLVVSTDNYPPSSGSQGLAAQFWRVLSRHVGGPHLRAEVQVSNSDGFQCPFSTRSRLLFLSLQSHQHTSARLGTTVRVLLRSIPCQHTSTLAVGSCEETGPNVFASAVAGNSAPVGPPTREAAHTHNKDWRVRGLGIGGLSSVGTLGPPRSGRRVCIRKPVAPAEIRRLGLWPTRPFAIEAPASLFAIAFRTRSAGAECMEIALLGCVAWEAPCMG
ncbi:hypothetical protein LZ30DRAFT_415876 [Colletotrichum cereale]|nr:hypothetical protein LZ30DRAFT_415876 [Colletotrichum cereale]